MKRVGHSVKVSFIVLVLLLVITSVPIVATADTIENNPGIRIAGADRYGTSYAVADEIHKEKGAFENVVVAFGGNFPDALSGGFLSKVKDAPLILINPNQETKVLSYIKKDMKKNGTVFLLGGTGVVRNVFENALKSNGIKTKRLAGESRFDTNLEILKESVKPGEEIIVASGVNYPDSLSGSAVGRGMLLVGKTLSDNQKAWIKSNGTKKFYILGGTAAVSSEVEKELKKYGTVERIGGANRYETSKKVAERFFRNAKKVALVNGKNFPDGLSGAPIAMMNNAPILLVADNAYGYAKQYVEDKKVSGSVTIGGTGAVSITVVNNIFVNIIVQPKPNSGPVPVKEPEHTHSWGKWEWYPSSEKILTFTRPCNQCGKKEGVRVSESITINENRIILKYEVVDSSNGKGIYDYPYSGKGILDIYVDNELSGRGLVDKNVEEGAHAFSVFLDGVLLARDNIKVDGHKHDWEDIIEEIYRSPVTEDEWVEDCEYYDVTVHWECELCDYVANINDKLIPVEKAEFALTEQDDHGFFAGDYVSPANHYNGILYGYEPNGSQDGWWYDYPEIVNHAKTHYPNGVPYTYIDDEGRVCATSYLERSFSKEEYHEASGHYEKRIIKDSYAENAVTRRQCKLCGETDVLIEWYITETCGCSCGEIFVVTKGPFDTRTEAREYSDSYFNDMIEEVKLLREAHLDGKDEYNHGRSKGYVGEMYCVDVASGKKL